MNTTHNATNYDRATCGLLWPRNAKPIYHIVGNGALLSGVFTAKQLPNSRRSHGLVLGHARQQPRRIGNSQWQLPGQYHGGGGDVNACNGYKRYVNNFILRFAAKCKQHFSSHFHCWLITARRGCHCNASDRFELSYRGRERNVRTFVFGAFLLSKLLRSIATTWAAAVGETFTIPLTITPDIEHNELDSFNGRIKSHLSPFYFYLHRLYGRTDLNGDWRRGAVHKSRTTVQCQRHSWHYWRVRSVGNNQERAHDHSRQYWHCKKDLSKLQPLYFRRVDPNRRSVRGQCDANRLATRQRHTGEYNAQRDGVRSRQLWSVVAAQCKAVL